MSETLPAILASEQQLINEAAEALPHQFNTCTYALGYIRQAVYLCLTCALPRGICSACSVACHTDHEQVELFPKRHFRCDCPTSAIQHPCTLHKTCEAENTENSYGQNFKATFCRCGRPYDANQERETMVQCLSCEDWYHESCLNLRERPDSLESVPNLGSVSTSAVHDTVSNAEADEAASEVSSSGLPPPFLSDTDYDTLICHTCVLSSSIFRRWAGTSGAIMVVRDDVDAPWTTVGCPSEDIQVEISGESETVTGRSLSDPGKDRAIAAGGKRTLEAAPSEASEETRAKRPRTSSGGDAGGSGVAHSIAKSVCIAPQQPRKALEVLDAVSSSRPNFDFGAGDVFLTDGWRTRWCRCDNCLISLMEQSYLLEEEETYEPPEDPDSGFSLEELGIRALQSLPRERAIDGIRAFNEMRDELLSYLRPFAQEGKVVNEADIRAFFEEKKEARRAQAEE
ncbi:uncharacterized protein FOMMEDRAFT_130921 [Fomitiporia mediterranea MF3/22]|uniref:uncharacterized protein n=1 Tax=Fomitiporia mediterranea (strain MF3/22) TaxID=694068 RepID=UPI00044082ED|nr:uncharacterized protein FOMMEDRAFT_130921 [Fomitiporia mediterranea MF3/22]EJD07863.1 hypothetical protein FOMMEDRAFT_130921 [Fomitiporia mediterranea MF3/22]